MHLTPEELLDLAEGSRPLSSAPHLTACEVCRQQLDELREVMATIDADVPEPSPLFWEHFSARVQEAVAADAPSGSSWLRIGGWSWGLAAAMSAVVVVIAVALTVRTPPTITPAPPAVAEVPNGDVGSAPAVDDPSFTLLGDLAGNLDWDAAAEAGIRIEPGTADSAVHELNAGELTELQRLLREAMGTSHVGV